MAEYVIVIVLVALAAILAIRYFGSSVKGQIRGASEQLDLLGPGSSSEGSNEKQYASTADNYPGTVEGSESTASEPIDDGGERQASRRTREAGAEGGQDEYSRAVSRLHRGVGDADGERKSTDEIRVNYLLLILLGFGLVGGAFVVLLFPRLLRKKQKKKRKFSLGERQEDQGTENRE